MFTTELERVAGSVLVDSDPEPSADYLWELTREAMAEATDPEPELPPGLDQWLPSPFLAAVVSALSPRELSGFDRIVLLKAQQRLVSHYQARGL